MFYNQDINEVSKQLKVNIDTGLSLKNITSKNKNVLLEEKQKSFFAIFFSQLKDPLIYILGVAFLISFLLKEYIDALIILTVVLLNALIGAFQERKAEKALESLKKMTTPSCIVKRDNKLQEIKAEDLVVGDIVILDTGRTIPADLRLISSSNLKIDESSLTGESIPTKKDANVVLDNNTQLGDRINMAYMSCNVSYGKGIGIVVATGMDTQIGRIAKMINDENDNLTPLQKKLGELGKILGMIALSICFLLLLLAIIQGRNIIQMLITSISLAVAAIPEGLPAVVTIVLALGVQKMVKVNTIVRKLHSVETLGSVNVICSDKTGTLTQNKMTVMRCYTNNKKYGLFDKNIDELKMLALGMSLCNDAFETNEQINGDPTEVALIYFAKKLGIHKSEIDKKYKRINELPFDSNRKMMSTVNCVDNKNICFTKGALDRIINKSKYILVNNKIEILNEFTKQQILNSADKMAKNAMRILALGCKYSSTIEESDLIFVGFVAMIDPPRSEAKEAIQSLKKANIKTIMITGDHKTTAFAIAKDLKIADNESQCISGEQLDAITDQDFINKVNNYTVFSRVSPAHKVKIVKALKENNNIVAMTGDGVNDAPSLKAADIGIAMGISGTDVAKSASDMILSDDNFASIEKAVKEGRGIYANIKKSLLFLLSSNIGEILVMFLGILLNLPIPLLAIHILWVNLLTDSFPALALGQDDNGDTLMNEKPRSVKESIFANGGLKILVIYGLTIGLASLLAYLIVPIMELLASNMQITIGTIKTLLNDPVILKKAQTYSFCTLAVSQLFHSIGMKNINKSIFDKRLFNNKLLIFSFVVGFILQILVTELPFLNSAFNTTHLMVKDWIIISMFSMTPLVIHEVRALIK